MGRRDEMLTTSGRLGFRIESRNSQSVNLFISQIEHSTCHTCASYLKIGNLLHFSTFRGHSCFFLSKEEKKKKYRQAGVNTLVSRFRLSIWTYFSNLMEDNLK